MKYNIPGRPETFRDHGAPPLARTGQDQADYDEYNDFKWRAGKCQESNVADNEEAERLEAEEAEIMRLGGIPS